MSTCSLPFSRRPSLIADPALSNSSRSLRVFAAHMAMSVARPSAPCGRFKDARLEPAAAPPPLPPPELLQSRRRSENRGLAMGSRLVLLDALAPPATWVKKVASERPSSCPSRPPPLRKSPGCLLSAMPVTVSGSSLRVAGCSQSKCPGLSLYHSARRAFAVEL